jgi:hypothetical protein
VGEAANRNAEAILELSLTVHGAVRAPRERNVAALAPAITDPLKSATLWGGVEARCSTQVQDPHVLVTWVKEICWLSG